jgi:LacI family transcriptional regulator
MRSRKRTGIADLAHYLGLSVSTVSRALNGYKDVNPETRARVVDAAQFLNYTPDLVSLKLRHGRTFTVGFVLSPSAGRFVEPFYIPLLTYLDESLRQAGYDLVVSSARPGPDEEAAFRRIVEGRRVDAVMFARTRPDDFRVRYLTEQRFPFVTLGVTDLELDYPYVEIEMYVAGRVACERLIAMGHQRIAAIHGPLIFMFCRKYLQGYRDAMAAAGLPVRPEWELEGDQTEDSGFSLAQRILELSPRPTAVVCSSDAIAFGLMQAVQSKGVIVGRDLSVIGCDDSPIAPLTHPPLTTFRSPTREAGIKLSEMILDLIAGGNPKSLVYEPELIVRESDKPVSGREA